jgi:hypothetical protein
MQNVRVKGKVPFEIGVEGIKLAKGWVCPLIGPSESPILQMDFIELASMKGGPEMNDATTINISLVFISRPPGLVEITKNKPTDTLRWLWSRKLGKKIIFSVMWRRSIDSCNLEVPVVIIVGVEDVHIRRQTELG